MHYVLYTIYDILYVCSFPPSLLPSLPPSLLPSLPKGRGGGEGRGGEGMVTQPPSQPQAASNKPN